MLRGHRGLRALRVRRVPRVQPAPTAPAAHSGSRSTSFTKTLPQPFATEATDTTVVNCLTQGKEAISGGVTIDAASLADDGLLVLASNGPSGTTGWTGTGKNVSGAPTAGSPSYTVHVTCVDPS